MKVFIIPYIGISICKREDVKNIAFADYAILLQSLVTESLVYLFCYFFNYEVFISYNQC